MTSYDHFLRLMVMIGLVIGGLMVTALVSAALMLLGGLSFAEIMEMSQKGTMDFSPNLIRGLLTVQHVMTFILPGLAFGWIFISQSSCQDLILEQILDYHSRCLVFSFYWRLIQWST